MLEFGQTLTIRFSHTEAESGSALEYVGQKTKLLLVTPEVDKRWGSDRVSAAQTPYHSQVSAPGHLVDEDEIMKAIPLRGLDIGRQTLSIKVLGGEWIY